MKIEDAIINLQNQKGYFMNIEDLFIKDRYDALNMAIRGLSAWNELKTEREEWVKNGCNPKLVEIVDAYLKDVEG